MLRIFKEFYLTTRLFLFIVITIVVIILLWKDLDFSIFFHPMIILFIFIILLCTVFFDLDIEEYEDIVALFIKKEENQLYKRVLSYNSDEGILLFKNKKILISKSKDSDPHYLLITLFKDINKTWNYDEIHIDWVHTTEEYSKDMWNKFYQASLAVNRKIAQETTIKDFLMPTKYTVKINKKYL